MKTIILCGGAGTRLWPLSRKSTPKQFAQIFNSESLFQKTFHRNQEHSHSYSVVVNQAQLKLCQEQVPEQLKKITHYLVEPIGRNTAPAIALAAMVSDPEEILLVVPSDHLIKDMNVYASCLKEAQAMANQGKLVTFGIKAQYPETGYGYIEADGNKVLSFKEKPNLKTAIKYLEKGNYFWNSGMFCFKAKAYLDGLKECSPEIYNKAFETFQLKQTQNNTTSFSLEKMQDIPSDSIDYALMEKSQNVCVIPSSFSWSDMGSFDSLDTELEKDEDGNTKNDQLYSFSSKNNFVLGSKRVIATFDVNDLIIVDTEDALLIGKKGNSQDVKELLERVKKDHPNLLD